MTEATVEPQAQEKTFTVGDAVSWESQAGGFSKRKEGVVVAIVPANEDTDGYVPDGMKVDASGWPRKHESYLVQVGNSKDLYWPLVSKLESAQPQKEPKAKKPRKEPLQVGKQSIIVDGKEIVFNKNQRELPGMPEISRYRKLAEAWVIQNEEIEEEQMRLHRIRQEIMMELKKEQRTEFAYRKGSLTYEFSIVPTDEKIKVSKKK